MTSIAKNCGCPSPDPLPSGYCRVCGKRVPAQKSEAQTPERVNIGEERKFAEWQIGMLEKGILQSKRMIHEIRQRYGIQE
jgi:hypothetical protein